MTIEELRAVPLELLIEYIIAANEYARPDIVAIRIIATLNAMGWKIEREAAA